MNKVLLSLILLFLSCLYRDYKEVKLDKKIKISFKEKVNLEYHFEKMYYSKELKNLYFVLNLKEKYTKNAGKIYQNNFFKISVNGKDAKKISLAEAGTVEPVSETWRCYEPSGSEFTRRYYLSNYDEFIYFNNLPIDKLVFEIKDTGIRFSKKELTKKDLEESFEDCN